MKTRILTMESMTPIEPYLTDHREKPGNFNAQVAFAVNLIVREGDHFALTKVPEQNCNLDEVENEDGTLDPFDLKREAADSLRRCLRPKARFARGYLLLLKILYDLKRWEELVTLGRECAALMPKSATAWAFVHLGANILIEKGLDAYRTDVRESHKNARRIIGSGRTQGMLWDMRVIDEFEAGLHDWSWRIRKKIEGEAITRTLKTEAELLTEAREQNVIDEQSVPPGLHSLIPLAESLGIGDDVLRAYAIARLTKKEKSGVVSEVGEKVNEISAWLDTFYGAGMPPDAAAFMYLLSAWDEMSDEI